MFSDDDHASLHFLFVLFLTMSLSFNGEQCNGSTSQQAKEQNIKECIFRKYLKKCMQRHYPRPDNKNRSDDQDG